jgi:hypothetical protein
MGNAKKPADHKPKKDMLELVRAEAAKQAALTDMGGRTFTITGRRGEAEVTTLDAMDWDAEVVGLIREGDYFGALAGMVSDEDEAALRQVRPSISALMVAFTEPSDDGDLPLGESQAS